VFTFAVSLLQLSIRRTMSLDICVADEVHLFVVVALLNIALYLVPCVKFDSFWYKACLAVDLGVLLKTIVETAIGPQDGHWPQDAGTNLFIALCFSLFFYVMAPNIWGTIFLVVGLLSVQSFWDGMYSQLQSFMQHSLDIIIDQTHTKNTRTSNLGLDTVQDFKNPFSSKMSI
jgi:hypothetical protein